MQTVSYMFMEEKLSLGIYFITLITLYAKVAALQYRSSDRLIHNSANNFHPLCQSSMVQCPTISFFYPYKDPLFCPILNRFYLVSYSFKSCILLFLPLSPFFSQLHQSSDFSRTNLSIFQSIYLYKTW